MHGCPINYPSVHLKSADSVDGNESLFDLHQVRSPLFSFAIIFCIILSIYLASFGFYTYLETVYSRAPLISFKLYARVFSI